MKTFKVMAALLSYPEADMIAALPELESALLREGALTGGELDGVRQLMREMVGEDLLDLQERYVGLFDRSRGLSLHLFEHVHGDSRDRGTAMIELAGLYRQRGLMIARAELPDYLPLFLEYLSHLDRDEARSTLGDVAHILAPIRQRLAKRGSSYGSAIAALLRLAEYIPASDDALANEEPDDTPEAIDRVWEEAAVTFGGPDAAAEAAQPCTRAAAMVERMNAR